MLLFPFVLMLIPIVNITLWSLYKRIKKDAAIIKEKYTSLTYEQAKEVYGLLSELVTFLENKYEGIEPGATNFFTKKMVRYYKDITAVHKKMRDLLASSLYLKVERQEPLSEKEKEGLEALNDIWGDDQDEVYARHTHFHIIRKAQ